MHKKVECTYEILFEQHEFPSPEGLLVIRKGDVWSMNDDTIMNIFGYGVIEDGHSLKLFYGASNETWAVDISSFRQSILNDATKLKRFIDSENNCLYAKRIKTTYDVSELKNHLASMNGIIIRGDGYGRKKYDLTWEQIGNPDWFILFRYTTNLGGSYSLAKILALTNDFPNNVFVLGHSTKGIDTFSDSNSVFFSLCGVDMPPELCLMKLKALTRK